VPTRTVAATTAIKMPGMRSLRLNSRMIASVPTPMPSVTQFVFPVSTPWMNAHDSWSRPSAWCENPNSFGSWLISTVGAMPFMYP
jgi:hypothetical protein